MDDFGKFLKFIADNSAEREEREKREKDDDMFSAAKEIANRQAALYEAYIDAGFTKEQSFDLLIEGMRAAGSRL